MMGSIRAVDTRRILPGATIAFCTVVLLIVTLTPLLWALSTSLKTESLAVTYPPQLFPAPSTVSSYSRALSSNAFYIQLTNSFIYAIGGVLLGMVTALPASFAISRIEFKGKSLLNFSVLMFALIPPVALLTPTYMLLHRLELVNNPVAVIIIFAARVAPQTYWFGQSFMNAVPTEIDDAASIDGASRLQILTRIILPLLKPGLAAMFVLGFITIWNDYITVATFAPEAAWYTLQVGLVHTAFQSIGMSWSYFMAYALLSALPVLVIFLLFQRWFIAGLTAGGVKA